MPGGAIVGIGCDRARGEIRYGLGTGADQPIMIRECDQGLRIIRPLSDGPLELWQRIGFGGEIWFNQWRDGRWG